MKARGEPLAFFFVPTFTWQCEPIPNAQDPPLKGQDIILEYYLHRKKEVRTSSH
jgi:hypothetical protein